MPKRKSTRTDQRQYWQAIFQQHQESGLSVRQFCSQQGINESSFYRWRKLLMNATATPAPFIPIHVQKPNNNSNDDGAKLDVVLHNGAKVRVPLDFDVAHLKRLLDVLEERSC